MSDKFSFYQTEGLWGIIENASDEKQTSIKSYFGSDLIIKRLNEQADQIDQLKQQLVEKEKELAYMTKQAKKFNNEAQKYYEDAYCNSFQNQKAIAELERLKEEFNGAFSFSTQQEMFDKYIDQQIAELKGETNE